MAGGFHIIGASPRWIILLKVGRTSSLLSTIAAACSLGYLFSSTLSFACSAPPRPRSLISNCVKTNASSFCGYSLRPLLNQLSPKLLQVPRCCPCSGLHRLYARLKNANFKKMSAHVSLALFLLLFSIFCCCPVKIFIVFFKVTRSKNN